MIHPRKLNKDIEKYLNAKQIIVITGMRRVGKTTLCQSIFESIPSKNKLFLDMENPIIQKLFEEENFDNIIYNLQNKGLISSQKMYIFIDEIQAFPEIVKSIKYLYDHYDIKFIVTGSSSYYLKNLFPESLSGRKFVFELKPLDFEEFLIFKGIPRPLISSFSQKEVSKNKFQYESLKGAYTEFLTYGGFPQVVLEDDISIKKMILQDILKSYFEKDIKFISQHSDIKRIRDLILLLMARVGSKLNVSKIASELEISRETVYSYINLLENTYFIYLIPSFSKEVDKQISRAKKIYLCDNGLLTTHVNVSDGQLLENSVFNCLLGKGNLKYFQTEKGLEIDFILDEKTAFEVKQKATKEDVIRIKKAAGKLDLDEYFVISKIFINEKGVIPASYL